MRNPSIRIRATQPADSAQIAELSGQLGYPASAVAIASRLARLLAHPDHHCVFVAVDGEPTLLGWIHAGFSDLLEYDQRGEIFGLVVHESARGRGVGGALVAAAEQWVLEHGCAEIGVHSNVVRKESHPFYERVGYERIKSQHVYRKQIGS